MHYRKIKKLFSNKFLGILIVFFVLATGISTGLLLLPSQPVQAAFTPLPSWLKLSHDGGNNIVMTGTPKGASPIKLTFNYVSGGVSGDTSISSGGSADGFTLPYQCAFNDGCKEVFRYLDRKRGLPPNIGIQIYGSLTSSRVTVDVYYRLCSYGGPGCSGATITSQYDQNYSATVSGADNSVGHAQWINAIGKPIVPLSSEGQYLEFVSPTAIYDTLSHTYYVTDGKGLFANVANLLSDGDTLYWPSNGVQHGNKCYGGLNVQVASGGTGFFGTPVYIKIFAIPTEYDPGTNSCLFANRQFAVSSYAGTNTGTDSLTGIVSTGTNNVGVHTYQDPITNVVEGQSGSDSTNLILKSVTKDMEFAMFEWEDSSTISFLGNGTLLTKLSARDQKSLLYGYAPLALPTDGGSAGTWEAFTTQTCKSNISTAYYPFLLIRYDNSSKSLANTDFGSQNAKAYIYSVNSTNSGWQYSTWNAGNDGCLFGGSAPSSNHTVENSDGTPGSNSGYTYITNLNQSLSATLPAALNPKPIVSTSSAPPLPTCQASDFSLAWLACSAVNAISDLETSIEKDVEGLLQTAPLVYSGSQCTSAANASQGSDYVQSCIYLVWSNFRLYANVILLIALLTAVLVEAIGGGVLEAYTIKKMLPRILVVAVLINLSIYFVGAMVDITNIIAAGVFDIILAPFRNAAPNSFNLNFNGVPFVNFPGSSILAGLALGGGIWGAFAGGFSHAVSAISDALVALAFMVGLPILLAVVGVLVTIAFRIVLIYFLIIVSPIAFALYALPGTEKYFRQWWKYLVQTLMVYPVVVIIFALTDVGAILLHQTSYVHHHNFATGVDNGITSLLSIAAACAPLFLIPFAFKISGGAIGSIHNAVTGARSKLHQNIKGDPRNPNSLQNRMKNRFAQARNEMGLSGSQIGERLNPRYLRKGDTGMSRRERRQQAVSARRAAGRTMLGGQALESNNILQHNKNNEKFLQAHANRELAIEKMKASSGAERAAWSQSIAAADLVPRTAATRAQTFQMWAASGQGHAAGTKGYDDLANTAADILGTKTKTVNGHAVGLEVGDPNAGMYADMMNSAQFAARQAGRYDLGGVNNGNGYNFEGGADKANGYTAGGAKLEFWQAGAEDMLGMDLGPGGKTGEVNDIGAHLQAALQPGQAGRDGLQAKTKKWFDQLIDGYSSPTTGNKFEIRKQIDGILQAAAASGTGLNHAEMQQKLRVAERGASDRDFEAKTK